MGPLTSVLAGPGKRYVGGESYPAQKTLTVKAPYDGFLQMAPRQLDIEYSPVPPEFIVPRFMSPIFP